MNLVRLIAELRGWFAGRHLERGARDPEGVQWALLQQILHKNRDTRFGKEHGFGEITSAEGYRERVPVRDYEGHRPYIDAIVAGDKDVLTVEAPFMFGTTSGTTCEPKLVPVNETWRRRLASLLAVWIGRASKAHPAMLKKKIVTITSPVVEGHTDSGIPFGAVSGLSRSRVPWIVRKRYAVPYKVALIEDYEIRYRVAMRFAIQHPVSVMVTPNPSTLMRLAGVARTDGPALVEAMRVGDFGFELDGLDEDQQRVMQLLKKELRPRPKRAAFLARLLKENGALVPKDFWPDLRVIGCWLGGSAGVQAERLRGLYGDVALRDIGFRATEATFSVPVRDGTAAGVLALHTNFYEFIHADDMEDENPKVWLAHELKTGEHYYILVTTEAGLYRYDINDVIEVCGWYGKAPEIAFVRKGRDMANITGEKLHVNQVLLATEKVAAEQGLLWEQFQVIPNVEHSRYDYLIELTGDLVAGESILSFVHQVDARLGTFNIEYGEKRKSGRLHYPQVYVMKRGWGERRRKWDVIRRGKRDSQYKWRYIETEWDQQNREEVEKELGSSSMTAT